MPIYTHIYIYIEIVYIIPFYLLYIPVTSFLCRFLPVPPSLSFFPNPPLLPFSSKERSLPSDIKQPRHVKL